MRNAINWFEIPVNDLDRAQRFYEAILGKSMMPLSMPQMELRMFAVDEMTDVAGALVQSSESQQVSATHGPLIYLNGNPDVQEILDRVEEAGGKVVLPKTEISPEYGYMAVIIDSEGNRIGLHSVAQTW